MKKTNMRNIILTWR